jgi:DNA-binding cell septation regulator SpoVG
LTVTAVEVKDRKDAQGLIGIASIDLNYAFRINDIKVYSRLGQTLVELPKYVSNSGNEYDQIRIFDSKLRQRIKDAIESRTPSASKSSRIGYKITNFEKNQWGGAVKFDGAVTINDAAEIQFRVIDGDSYEAFVAWPSVKEQGEYVDKIFPCNKKVKDKIEATIIKRYHQER